MVFPRRRLALAAVVFCVASATLGAAATLGGVSAQGIGAGRSVVASCDTDSVGMTYAVSGGTVSSVTVTNLAAACAGGALRVVLAGSTGASLGAGGPVTISGTSATVSLSPQPTATAVTAAHVSVVGP